jgi:small subunit ribosomal protein S6
MAKPAPEYELVLMLDPEVPDERRDQIAVEARKRIENAGDLKQERSWGLRKMAYEMDHRGEAEYHLFQFEGENPLLERLDHTLKITDGVLRFRIIRLKPGSPPPPAPRQAGRPREIAPAEEETATVAPRSVADAPKVEETESEDS